MTIIHFITHHWLAITLLGVLVAGCIANPVLALTLARKYWPYILQAVLLFAAYEMGYHTCNVANQYANAQERSAQASAYQKEVSRLQGQADAADEALRIALAAPKAAPVVREVIRANPSHCVVPKPVADSLRDAIRQGNKAVSG